MTPGGSTFYSFDYRSTAFALIASLLLQGLLLSLLGIWCGGIPSPPPPAKPQAIVFLETRLPARKPAPEPHSSISSSMSAAAEKAARAQRYIDDIIHSMPEQPRPKPPRKPSPPPKPRSRKPVSRVVPQPVRRTAPLPVPLIGNPVELLPDPSRSDAPRSDLRDTMRRRNPGKPAQAGPPDTSSQNGATQASPAVSRPAPGNEVATYLQLVRRRLEDAKTYPANARRRGQSGIVILRFRIDAVGSVSGQTTSGTAPAELHAATLALLRNRRFPAPPMGWNTNALLEIPIRYSLRDSGSR